jgi:hypothetical protein
LNPKTINFLTLAIDFVICFTWFCSLERTERPLELQISEGGKQ